MMARDNFDNVIVTGYITANNIYTRKYDRFGNFLWERFSASGIHSNYEKPFWINTDNNNNVYVVGCRYVRSSSLDYPGAIVILKYNAAGTLLWKKKIPMSIFVNTFTGFGLRSEVDNNGNLYIGTVAVTPSGFVLIKLSPNGTTLFTSSNNLNGVNQFRSMRLKGNKVVLTGSSGNLSAAPVVAFDTSGNLLWTASLLGQSGNDVEMDDGGNVYLLSSYANQVSATSGQDIEIYKLNPSGTQLWKKNFDFAGYDFPTRFTFVGDKLSVIGYGSINASYFDWITFQINTSGTMLWNARYNGTAGNDEQSYFLSAKANGEVFVTGKGGPMFTQSNGSSYLRMITLKYSNTGIVKWIDSVNIYSGWGIASTLARDSSLFVLSDRYMTAFHFLDYTGTGTCTIPTGLNVSNVANTSTTFSWTPVAGAALYHLRYKTTTAATWTVASINLPSITLTGLTAGTTYNYAVEAICSSSPSGYSATQTFTTTGTGFCTTGGQSQLQEYLSFVWIAGIQNSTGRDNGYGDYTHLSTPLTQGQTVTGYLSGLVPYPEFENYSIWIDYNHDNDFTDAGEQVVKLLSDFTGWIAVSFTVPANAPTGPTRMRVTMSSGNSPSPCGVYARGETEDYTVIINEIPAPNCADGIQNGTETGVDCGGSCFPCPTCNDGIRNGDETGIDCGGSCPPCTTCTDGIQNGNETGVDCGGSCPACPPVCSYVLVNSNNFESGWGIWNDGGTDCRRNSQDAAYAYSGTYCVQLRDNTSTSVMTTGNMNLAQYQKIKIEFTYIPVSMDDPTEDFWLQVSTNGGSTYSTVKAWNLNGAFVNNQRYFETVELPGVYTSTTRFRFRCDASDDNDFVYIDDVVISGCTGTATLLRSQVRITDAGEKDNLFENLQVFPNPANKIINFKNIIADDGNTLVKVYDVTGKILIEKNISENRLDVSRLGNGFYLIRIFQKGKVYSSKFVIAK